MLRRVLRRIKTFKLKFYKQSLLLKIPSFRRCSQPTLVFLLCSIRRGDLVSLVQYQLPRVQFDRNLCTLSKSGTSNSFQPSKQINVCKLHKYKTLQFCITRGFTCTLSRDVCFFFTSYDAAHLISKVTHRETTINVQI